MMKIINGKLSKWATPNPKKTCLNVSGNITIHENFLRWFSSSLPTTSSSNERRIVSDMRAISEWLFPDPPSLTVVNGDQLGWAGTTLNVTCVAAGLPVPSMNWFRGENYLTDSDTYRVTTTRSGDTVTSVLSVGWHFHAQFTLLRSDAILNSTPLF
jgi:hypothetical protein